MFRQNCTEYKYFQFFNIVIVKITEKNQQNRHDAVECDSSRVLIEPLLEGRLDHEKAVLGKAANWAVNAHQDQHRAFPTGVGPPQHADVVDTSCIYAPFI